MAKARRLRAVRHPAVALVTGEPPRHHRRWFRRPVGMSERVCWGYQDERSSQLLRTHIAHLRRKLGLATQGTQAIQAVLGTGYRLLLPEAQLPP